MHHLSGLNNQTLLSVLQILLEQNFEAVVVTDGDPVNHKIIYVNNQFCKLTGYSREELYGKSPGMLSGEKTNRAVIKRLKQALADGLPFTGATTNYRKDGSEYSVQWNIYPVLDDKGEPSHFVSIQKDLTEFRASLARLKSSSQSFRQFLSELSGKHTLTVAEKELKNTAEQEIKDNAEVLSPYLNTKVAEEEDDLFDMDFFDFDDAAVKAEDEVKHALSAQHFFASTELELDAIADICSVTNSMVRLLEALEIHEMTASDRKELVEELQELSNSIFYVEEFIDISIALSELTVFMIHHCEQALDFMIAEALKGLLNDLITWVNEVFVHRTATDVHWLDNSITGSCKQILVFMRLQLDK